jgi:adenylosuccinate lyase
MKKRRRNLRRLKQAVDNVSVGKISGAVGTFAHLDPQVEEAVCRKLGLQFDPVSTQIVQRDRHAELMAALAITAASLEKIALEVRGLQRTEVREVEEYFAPGQKGSSAMPHKRNPVTSEQICGLAPLRSFAGCLETSRCAERYLAFLGGTGHLAVSDLGRLSAGQDPS